MKPAAMNWSSKNVMPMISLEDLPQDKKVVAVVYKKEKERFFSLTEGEWAFVRETENTYIYQRDAKGDGTD